MGADLVRGITRGDSTIPVVISRDYVLPGFVGPETLVVCSSYSGNTGETLSAFQQAQIAGAKIIIFGAEGRLLEVGAAYPKIRIRTRGMPRSVLVESVLAFLGLFRQLGLAKDIEEPSSLRTFLEDAIRQVDVSVPESDNRAKILAQQLYGRMPMVVGVGHLGPVARRWKGQFNENADQLAFYDELPEFNHNSIQGLNLPPAARKFLHAVFLHPKGANAETVQQGKIAAGLLESSGIGTSICNVSGLSALEQVLMASIWGDFTSLYLAVLNRVKPNPIDNIAQLKRELTSRDII